MTTYNIVRADRRVKVGKIKIGPDVAKKLNVKEGEFLRISFGDGKVLFETQIGDYGFARINKELAEILNLNRSIVRLEKIRYSHRKTLEHVEIEIVSDGTLDLDVMSFIRRVLIGKPVGEDTIVPIDTPSGPLLARIVKTEPPGIIGLVSNDTNVSFKVRG